MIKKETASKDFSGEVARCLRNRLKIDTWSLDLMWSNHQNIPLSKTSLQSSSPRWSLSGNPAAHQSYVEAILLGRGPQWCGLALPRRRLQRAVHWWESHLDGPRRTQALCLCFFLPSGMIVPYVYIYMNDYICICIELSAIWFPCSVSVCHKGHTCLRETLRTRWSKWSTMFPRRRGGRHVW